MSTAQQLGLIGNSIKVQSLPTASAETFGAGNRFYTLIGQQEGYITGHTYRTVVANDVYSWEDVAGGNYNTLDNIPVINQDLTASGFTPVANTYYRHTGATNNTFTQGVIYYYDGTEYKALDGSGGGGTTLNKYTLNVSYENRYRIRKAYQQAKGRVYIDDQLGENSTTPEWLIASIENAVLSIYATSFDNNTHQYYKVYIRSFPSDGKQYYKNFTIEKNVNPSMSTGASTGQFNLVYYNDTEII